MFTSAEDVYLPGKWLFHRNICFDCRGRSSICWEAKNSKTFSAHKHFVRPAYGKHFQIYLFPSVKAASLGLGWEDAGLCRWGASLHPRTADATPDGETLIIEREVPLHLNTRLSTWRPVLPSALSYPSSLSGPAPCNQGQISDIAVYLKGYQVNSSPLCFTPFHANDLSLNAYFQGTCFRWTFNLNFALQACRSHPVFNF